MQFFPFDSQISGYDESGHPIYDRPADAALLRAVFGGYFTNGVLTPLDADALKVTEGEGMTLTMKAGAGVINGAIALQDTDTDITIEAAEALPRIDRIVLRLDDNVNVRAMSVVVLKGTAASTPAAPAFTRTATMYDLVLADVAVPANVTALTAANITDRRSDLTLCGACGARVTEETILSALNSDQIRHITAGTADMVSGVTPLDTGSIYLCYEGD